MGNKVAQIIDEWNKQGRYTDAYYLHGLAVETTEALADWVNYKIKEDSVKGGWIEVQLGLSKLSRYNPTFHGMEIIEPFN